MLQRNRLMMVSMAFAVILILFGGLLLFNYDNMMKRGSFLIGIIFIIGAIFFLIKYMSNRNSMQTFDMSILFMIFCLGFGLVFMFIPTSTETLFKGLIGILMMLMGASKIESTLHLKQEPKKHKLILMLIGILGIGVGLLVIINIDGMMREWVLSITLILFGMIDVFISHYLSVKLDRQNAEE